MSDEMIKVQQGQEPRLSTQRATTLPPTLFPVAGRNPEQRGSPVRFSDPPVSDDDVDTSEDVTRGVGYTSLTPREGWNLNKERKKKIQSKSIRRKKATHSMSMPESNEAPLRSKSKQQRPREYFYSLLRHSASANEFKLTVPPQAAAMVDLWRDLDSVLRSVGAPVDAVVGQSMIQKVFAAQQNQKELPSSYRKRLATDYSNLEISEQIDIVENIQQEVFGWLLLRHAGSGNKRKTIVKRKLTKSIHVDPFEDPNSNLVRFFPSEEPSNDPSQLMAATTEKIIYFLTRSDTELYLRWTYIFTCSYYTKSPSEFLSLLVDRFHLVLLKPQTNEMQKAEVQIALIRIVDVLKMWMNTHVSRVRKSKKIQNLIRDFAENTTKAVTNAATQGLLNYLNSMVQGDESVCEQSLLISTQTPPKSKKLDKHVKSIQDIMLDDIHPLEAARQIALIDHALYRAILPDELLHLNWTRSKKHELAPNVLRMIKQFNSVGEWVITQIVTTTKPSYRVKNLARLIEIGYECYRIGNFNGAMAFVSGLNSNKVTRLKATWNDLSSSSWDQWEELVSIFKLDDNFSALREKTVSTSLPMIPYLGMYLSGLTFKEGGESNYTDDGLINVAKLMYVGNVILQIQKGQQTPFSFNECALLQEFFMKLPTLSEEEYAEQRASRRSKRKSILVRGGSVPSLASLKLRKSTKYPSDLKLDGESNEGAEGEGENLPRAHSTATAIFHSPRGHSSPPEKKKEGSKSRRKRFFKGFRPPSSLRKRESSTSSLADMQVAL